MSTFTLHPQQHLAARVAAFFMSRHRDWEIAQYHTRTYHNGQLVAETPEITYGQLRRTS